MKNQNPQCKKPYTACLKIASILFCLQLIFACTTIKEKTSPQVETQKDDTTRSELKLGIDRLDEFKVFFEGKRVGLITNATGINRNGIQTIDVLHKSVNLVALFSPEHGIRGSETAGAIVANSHDTKTGLPVYSLYGKEKRPTQKMLAGIDVLCFDIQDVGSRFYTYIWTMAYAMEACAKYGIEFVVFDRPNPIGNSVEGAILQKAYRSFVGYFPIAQRHGMTVGELALMFNAEFKIKCSLKVIPMQNYSYATPYRDYKLMWVPTSPNIPHQKTALLYSGMCLFEGVNLSVGRGTTMPFEYIGAPYINAEKFSDAMNELHLDGVFFYPAYFTPTDSVFKSEPCRGVQVIVTDEEKIKPVTVAVYMFAALKKMYPSQFKVRDIESRYASVNLLSGTSYFTDANFDAESVLQKMNADIQRFHEMRKPYLLYE